MKKYLWLTVAVGLGIFTRSYQYLDRFNYAHDNDLASWIVKDIVVDKHVRLIGQLTSSPGIYIGPLWYYLQIPFYLAGHMDPIYVPVLSILVGISAIVSVYWVMHQIYGSEASWIAALIYAVSWGISTAERDIVPTTSVFLWSIWFLYAINMLLRGQKRGLVLVAVLWALIWHINLALIFSVPLVIGVLLYRKHKYKFKDFVLPVVVIVVMSLPLLAFEARHQFNQTKAFFGTARQLIKSDIPVTQKAQKVILYSAKNANNLFWVKPDQINWSLLPIVILGLGIYSVTKHKITLNQSIVYIVWWLIYLALFSINPLNLSEYYLDGFSVLWVVMLSVFLASIIKTHKFTVVVILGVIVVGNLYIVVTQNLDQSGYLQKKALVSHIAADARAHGYPCIAISYMTDPGRDLGYRYWYWLNNLHVNQPKSGSPVYTIVFPHPRANRLDATFGALGLVYPDYSRYTQEQVDQSCLGQNANLTDPMFGFTK